MESPQSKSDLAALIHSLANGGARQADLAAGLAQVLRTLEGQAELIRDHDRWLWAAKGALALTFMFIGLVVYVFNDVRNELRRKIDAEVIIKQVETLDHHLSYIDGRLERLRDMLPAPYEHRREP